VSRESSAIQCITEEINSPRGLNEKASDDASGSVRAACFLLWNIADALLIVAGSPVTQEVQILSVVRARICAPVKPGHMTNSR